MLHLHDDSNEYKAMSTESISHECDDRFSDSSTVIGIDKTREEYLKLFSRQTISTFDFNHR